PPPPLSLGGWGAPPRTLTPLVSCVPPPRAEAPSRGSPGVPERPPPPPLGGRLGRVPQRLGGGRGGRAPSPSSPSPTRSSTSSTRPPASSRAPSASTGCVSPRTGAPPNPPGTPHGAADTSPPPQNPFLSPRQGRRLKEQQEMAAAVIQRCYRKYKQFALYQRMTQAAILIQSKFRSYAEQKRFQRRRRAAVLIQQRYRSHREHQRLQQGPRAPPAGLPPRLRGTFLTIKQDQAARKIMRFLRRCRHRMEELKQSKEGDSLQKRGLAS
uniref:Calmodulin binding transcription activator 2 n=1 Tax=Aquila chrysaetos chrysaetos TaxID=223781 RepID=A0A663F5W3_AQUCH